MVGELVAGKGAVAFARFTSTKLVDLFQARRREKIWESLALGGVTVDSPEVQRDEFISCYLATEAAVFQSTSQEKLYALVGMFVNGVQTKKIFDQADRFQEVLSIVSDLSNRELAILVALYAHEREYGSSLKMNAAKDQLEFLSDRCGIDQGLMKALLERLKRTGLLLSGSDMTDTVDLALTGRDAVYLSALASELKAWVMFTIDDPHARPLDID